MGTWGPGPFQNDAAADFLAEAAAAPARSVSQQLREIAKSPADRYLEFDTGAAGWAACELVALALGYGDASILDDQILDLAGKLRPKEADRSLALQALPRLVDLARSELAQLWHQGGDGARFDESVAALRARLESAASGPRESPKAKVGDVIVLAATPEASELIVVQVVGPGEVAVFEGTYCDEQAALATLKDRPARRVPTSVNRLLRRGRTLGNVPPRKEIRKKKLYAGETGSLESYFVSSARVGGWIADRVLAIACLVALPSACNRPTLNEDPDWEIPRPPPDPVAPSTSASMERSVATHVGREARIGSVNPKHWEERCLIHRACAPFKVLEHCDAKLPVLDSFANPSTDREGQAVALRGTLNLGSFITTAAACRQKPHDPRRPCCNQVGTPAFIQCGSMAVLLDSLGCSGDESRLCCNTPAFGQIVVAAGKLRHIPVQSGGIEWQLDDPRLCLEAP